MLIRIFGITTPLGDYLYKNVLKNLYENINCYSNDGGNWQKSELKFENQSLIINFKEPFVPRRGRINCSLNDNGKWRWFGTQFTVKKD